MKEDEKFEKLTLEMFTKLMEENPEYATFLGLHDPYDKQLADRSSKNVFRSLELSKQWVDKMKATLRYGTLSSGHKIDWKIIENSYEKTKFLVYEHRVWERNPDAFDTIGGVFIATCSFGLSTVRVDIFSAPFLCVGTAFCVPVFLAGHLDGQSRETAGRKRSGNDESHGCETEWTHCSPP